MMEAVKNNDGSVLKKISAELGDASLIIGVVSIVLLLVVPIPSFFLDIFLVGSISLSLLILLIGVYASKALEFSVFPTMLLFSTLGRLALNIASTRLILLQGSEGDGAAGEVIRAFGFFVAGGNYVVGFVVFVILVLINFVVITKGAGRIAEVAARFTLDAMPGKQLAIDADLNAGIITEDGARTRRENLEQESDFYGAMDGASKFVRGDAIAGIIITLINIIGGLIIGMVQEGLSFSEAGKIYTILSVGDGLVSQIPALVISVAAGVIVTKVSKKTKLSDDIRLQAFTKWRPIGMSSVIVVSLGLVPGLPFIPFFLMGGTLGTAAFFIYRKETQNALSEDMGELGETEESVQEQIDTVPALDMIELEVGYDLIPIVDQRSGGDFPARIVGIRKQFATEMGVILPSVHIRDNLKLRPAEYVIYIKGSKVAQAELMPHHCLALDPGNVSRTVEGVPTEDPTFGLPALWIPENQKEAAIVSGYTVVDLSSVMATHLIEIVRKYLSELFGLQELDALMENFKQTHPRVVQDLIPELMSYGQVLKILQNLLRERVSIRDLLSILESLVAHAPRTQDSDRLTEHVRVALGRNISQQHLPPRQETLYAITLSKELEDQLVSSLSPSHEGDQLAVDPDMAKNLIENLGNELRRHLSNNQSPVLLTNQQIRPHLYRLIERFIPNLPVLAHSEVAGRVQVQPIGMVGVAA